MKNTLFAFVILLVFFGCSNEDENEIAVDNENEITVSIEATGLSDGNLARNNTATFAASVGDFEGNSAELSYRWTLAAERGELTDGSNTFPNPMITGSSILCRGITAGEERIVVEVLNSEDNMIATSALDFMIIDGDGGDISRGCFDQPKIIYSRGGFVHVMNFDGSGEQYLGLATQWDYTISPNGQWIAYNTYSGDFEDEGWTMQLVDCDGNNFTTIAGGLSEEWFAEDYSPEFSPDSKTLYFLRPDPSSEPAVTNGGRPKELVAYDIETGERRFLTSLYQQDEQVHCFTVSPATGEVAVVRRTFSADRSVPFTTTLAIMQPETGFSQDLAVLPVAPNGRNMDWSSDGKDIIYSAIGTEPGIYRINVTSGSQPLLVFADPSPESLPPGYPHYYANDTRIAWTGQENGNNSIDLWSIDANGNDMQPLLQIPQTVFLFGVLD